MNLVVSSAIFSLIVQIVAGVFLVLGYFYKLKPEDKVLKDIITFELVVQIVEALMYVVLIKYFISGNIDTSLRYFDWFISTPIMLIATMLFLIWLHRKPVPLKETFKEERVNVSLMVIFNAMMLVFGFLGEKGIINKWVSFWGGSGFLVGAFAMLYKYGKETKYGRIFLGIMFAIWSLYGFAFLMPLKAKNVSYNVLDLFAKNFYGVFLYFVIRREYAIEDEEFCGRMG